MLLQLVGPAVALHVAETMHEAFPDRFGVSENLGRLVAAGKPASTPGTTAARVDPEVAELLTVGDAPLDRASEVRDRALDALAEEVRLMLDEGVVADGAGHRPGHAARRRLAVPPGRRHAVPRPEGVSERVTGHRFLPPGWPASRAAEPGVGVPEPGRAGPSYDLVAERYAAEIAGELTHKPLDRGLLDAVAELAGGGPVADVGCGPGHVAAYLAGRGARTVGLDLSPGMCAVARAAGVPAAAADMTALPLRAGSLAGLVCLYAVIHLDASARAVAYREFARVLQDGGRALIAFHTSDPEHPTGSEQHVDEWWGRPVDLTFRYLDPDEEVAALSSAGLALVARLDRSPHDGLEHPSHRSYLVVGR